MSFRYRSARRRFLAGLAGAGIGLSLPRPSDLAFAQAPRTPTPACDDGDEPTPEQTAGPFYIPDSPRRSVLRQPGMAGVPITLAGHVLALLPTDLQRSR